MSCVRLFGLKFLTLLLAVQLYAAPAVADSFRSGGFITIDSKSVSLHLRSKHHVHRYYGAPIIYHRKTKPSAYHHKEKSKVYYQKTKPKAYYNKRKKQRRSSVRAFPNRLASPYHIPQTYGISQRGFRHSRY
ncbi:hypothetical protein [Ruegeria arenilitoris]|uniref:hypothetical protein n=1 Tax=Ruegeria arenilitoris TaxID=1173585 RepID=UPI001479B75F|nr:hypothetical protein [Ruegeria arenilitoris]